MKLRNKIAAITAAAMLAFTGVGFAAWVFTKDVSSEAPVTSVVTAAIEAEEVSADPDQGTKKCPLSGVPGSRSAAPFRLFRKFRRRIFSGQAASAVRVSGTGYLKGHMHGRAISVGKSPIPQKHELSGGTEIRDSRRCQGPVKIRAAYSRAACELRGAFQVRGSPSFKQ